MMIMDIDTEKREREREREKHTTRKLPRRSSKEGGGGGGGGGVASSDQDGEQSYETFSHTANTHAQLSLGLRSAAASLLARIAAIVRRRLHRNRL